MRSSLESVSGERPKILTKLLEYTGKLSIILYLGALYYTANITGYFGQISEHTRVSEHALMPGLVTERFNKDGLLSLYLRNIASKSDRSQRICKEILALNLPCYEQNWSISIASQNETGRNIYTAIRARRSAGVEAMLLVAEINHKEAVAAMMAYAAFAKEQVYWARDIFFLFVDGEALGMEAFLSKYYSVTSTVVKSEDLHETGGTLIGGIVLKSQKTSRKRNTIRVQLNQVNGQLPNLDLFNSVVRIAGMGKFGLETIIYDVYDTNRNGEDWALLMPLRALFTQGFVAVEGSHSVFGKYGVQGLSIAIPLASFYPLAQSTRLVEAVARALNNVLERFHQSFFMYILTSEDSFLSIAYYMPCMSVIAPLLLFAYREWVHLKSFKFPISWAIFHLYGLAVWILSTHFFSAQQVSNIGEYCILALLLLPAGLILPRNRNLLSSLRLMTYLSMALILMSIALINFSLAFLMAIISVPVYLKLSRPVENVRKQWIRIFATVLFHPLLLGSLFWIYMGLLLGYKIPNDYLEIINQVHIFISDLIRKEIIYESIHYKVLCLFAVPLWNIIVYISIHNEEQRITDSKKNN